MGAGFERVKVEVLAVGSLCRRDPAAVETSSMWVLAGWLLDVPRLGVELAWTASACGVLDRLATGL